MSMDQQQLVQSIYDLIYDSLTMAPAGFQPATSSASTLLSLALPGLPLDPAEFSNPWTPGNPAGDPVAAENFAWLVDAVPEVSAVFRQNGNSIEQLYGQIVQANTPATRADSSTSPAPPPAPAPVSPALARGAAASADRLKLKLDAGGLRSDVLSAQRSLLASLPQKTQAAFGRLYVEGTLQAPRGEKIKTLVESPAFRKYLDQRALRDQAVTQYMAQLLQMDQRDAAEKKQLSAALSSLEAKVKETAKGVEEANAGQVEQDMASVSGGFDQNNSVAAIFATARLNFEMSKLGSMLGPGYSWHMTLAQPQNWFSPQASFFDVDIRTSRALRVNAESRFPKLGGLAASSGGLWLYRAQDKLSIRPIAQESREIRVRFRFARVNVRRPWLDASLLSLGGWAMAGRRRNDLSTGSMTNNTGLFPLLPTSIIVARDLQISAEWSQKDVSFIRERIDKKDLAFGPFALSGQYKRPRSKAATVVDAAFDGLNISAPGLQVIGWLSKLNPACPPLDG